MILKKKLSVRGVRDFFQPNTFASRPPSALDPTVVKPHCLKASAACNEAIEHHLLEGQLGHDGVDHSALRYLVEHAQYEGYVGEGINGGLRVLEMHMSEVSTRSLSCVYAAAGVLG